MLGHQATKEKSNEIRASPLLLERGTQTEIAQKILDGGGDYCLSLKENRPLLHEKVERFFADPEAQGLRNDGR